jgi:hypothetical protein
MLALSLVIGHHFMAAEHAARSHADVLELAANWRSDSQLETGMHITATHRRRSYGGPGPSMPGANGTAFLGHQPPGHQVP